MRLWPRLAALSLLLAHAAAHAQDPGSLHVQLRPLGEVAEPARHQIAADARARHDSWLSAETQAIVLKLHADVGMRVGRGALLIELDARDAEVAVAQAAAQLAAARARFELAGQRRQRGMELRADGHVSADELLALDTAERAARSELEIAEAGLRAAQRQREKTRILAPFDAVVMERTAQQGQLATIGSPLIRLVDASPPEVAAAIPDAWAEDLVDAQATWFVDAQGQRFPLHQLRLTDAVDAAGRTRQARLQFSGASARAGSSGQLVVESRRLRVPANLLVQREGQLGVFVAQSGQARFHAIAQAHEGRSGIVDLPAETLVVVGGQQALRDGEALPNARSD